MIVSNYKSESPVGESKRMFFLSSVSVDVSSMVSQVSSWADPTIPNTKTSTKFCCIFMFFEINSIYSKKVCELRFSFYFFVFDVTLY